MNMLRSSALFLCLLSTTSAFLNVPKNVRDETTSLKSAVGGWGIGQSRELTDGEKNEGERRAPFEGYQLRDRGEFLQSIQQERNQLKKDEMDELLGVAKMAGLDVKPSTKFDDVFDEDDDELDVSVQWDDDVEGAESITRMDEDTGAPGVW